MPNMLVHFAVQGGASRGLWRRLDVRFFYLGCLLPDVPWILRRVLAVFDLPVDSIDVRLYLMAQASLAGTLLLAGACAALSAAPRPVFALLAVNALAHLLLDASEVKWGNGVHLAAPFSWRMTSFDLVSGEHLGVLLLTLAGALLAAWDVARPRTARIGFDLRPARLAVAGACVAAYCLAPLPFLGAIEAGNSYSVKTLREVDRRPGRGVGLDRARFVPAPEGGRVVMWTGESVGAVGAALPVHAAVVSLRGTFVAPGVLRVEQLVVHHADRNLPSYTAVALLALLWLRRPPQGAGPHTGEAPPFRGAGAPGR